MTPEEEADEDDSYFSSGGNSQTSNKILFKNRKRNVSSPSSTFNSSVTLKAAVEGEVTEEKAVLKGSKVVMPEYVIGQKINKDKKVKRLTATNPNKNQEKILKLGHLFEEEDEED